MFVCIITPPPPTHTVKSNEKINNRSYETNQCRVNGLFILNDLELIVKNVQGLEAQLTTLKEFCNGSYGKCAKATFTDEGQFTTTEPIRHDLHTTIEELD